MSGIKAPATADDRLTHLDSSSNFSELTWFDRFYFNVQSPDGSLVSSSAARATPMFR